MTQKDARPDDVVMVECLGIACEIGFSLNPAGFDPSYASFHPGKAVPLAKHYADYLVSQDASKFRILKNPLEVANAAALGKTSKTAKTKADKK